MPADINSHHSAIVDVIKFPVTYDLAQKLGTQLTVPDGIEMHAPIAMAEIYMNSKVTINGKNVTKSAYELCDKQPVSVLMNDLSQSEDEAKKPSENTQTDDVIWGEGY